MHHGTDYDCTGHAHFAGDHIRCTSPAHPVLGFSLDFSHAPMLFVGDKVYIRSDLVRR